MRRYASALALPILLSLAVAAPALAAKPVRECPNAASGFAPMTIEATIAMGVALGGPPDLADAFLPVGEAIDANDDPILCVQDRPNTPGSPAWLFNAVDNVSNAG